MFTKNERNRFGRRMTGRAMVATLVIVCCTALAAYIFDVQNTRADGPNPNPTPLTDVQMRALLTQWADELAKHDYANGPHDGPGTHATAMAALYAAWPDVHLLPTLGLGEWETTAQIKWYFENVFLVGKPTMTGQTNNTKFLGIRDGKGYASNQGLYIFTKKNNQKINARFTFIYESTWNKETGMWGDWKIIRHHSSKYPRRADGARCVFEAGEQVIGVGRDNRGDVEPCVDEDPCLLFDHNNDGMIDGHDLLALLAAWGQCPPDDGDE